MIDQGILETAKQAASAASAVLLQHFDAPEIQHKHDESHNLVTQADLESEAIILQTIRKAYPQHDVLGEEGLETANVAADHLWVVDPLDGTTNYAQGLPQFCTAIAYVRAGVVQVGVVLDPCRNELFHAVRGEGAFLNGRQIRVSNRDDLRNAVIATGFYYDRGEMMRRTLHSIERLFGNNVRGIRRLGSAALDQCWVACGRMDAFFEYQLSPWDYAAASLIVEEAGGRCGDRDGQPLRLTSGSLVVANHCLFDEVVDIVRW